MMTMLSNDEGMRRLEPFAIHSKDDMVRVEMGSKPEISSISQ